MRGLTCTLLVIVGCSAGAGGPVDATGGTSAASGGRASKPSRGGDGGAAGAPVTVDPGPGGAGPSAGGLVSTGGDSSSGGGVSTGGMVATGGSGASDAGGSGGDAGTGNGGTGGTVEPEPVCFPSSHRFCMNYLSACYGLQRCLDDGSAWENTVTRAVCTSSSGDLCPNVGPNGCPMHHDVRCSDGLCAEQHGGECPSGEPGE